MDKRRYLDSVNPSQVAAYLSSRGWVCVESLPGGSYWSLTTNKDAPELLVPLDPSYRDYRTRTAALISALESYEGRSWDEIASDMSGATTDTVRLRFLGPAFDAHSVSLERGVQMYQETRELILAAACAAVKPRRVYAARKPNLALQYLSQLQLVPPARGSYVIALRSPVPPWLGQRSLPGLASNEGMAPPPDDAEPFARQVISTLGAALEGTARALRASHQIDPPARTAESAFDVEVAHGLSANLCGALSQLLQLSQARDLEISISGAPARPLAPRVLSFSAAHAPLLGEVARSWRAYAPRDDFELRGSVVGLHRIHEHGGQATIHGFIDDMVRAVRVELSAEAYALAISAHERFSLVACEGELVREGPGYALRALRRFRVLAEGEPLSDF